MAITVTIDNSYSNISGLSTQQHRELKDILSYEIDAQAAYFSGSMWNRKRSLLDKKGNFPTGLLHYVKRYIIAKNFSYVINDIRCVPRANKRLFNLTLSYTPYQRQIEATNVCRAYRRGTVSMVTGYGKSITMALLIDDLQLRTLVIVPNLTLKKQLTESFTNYFGNLDNITIENIDSTSLNKATDYDVLIIDEAHHVAAATYQKLNKKVWNKIYHRFHFTGTAFRNKTEETLLFEALAGEVIYKVSYKEAVEDGAIVPVEAFYIELPKKQVKGRTWNQVYSELIVNNKERNQLLAELMDSLNDKSVLTLVKEIKHGENIKALRPTTIFANGTDADTGLYIKAFNNVIGQMIGTTGVLGEGVDTRPAEWIIIAGLGKSKPAFMQQVGRGLRKYPGKHSCKVIIFFDPTHKFTIRHFKEQAKILKEEYGIYPIKVDLK